MEANIVIELKQLTEVRTAYPANDVSRAQMIADQKKMEKQAEISFKAGMKKVVAWVNKEDIIDDYCLEDWQAKLQEWGIKED